MKSGILAGVTLMLAAVGAHAQAVVVAFDIPPSQTIFTSATVEGFYFTSPHFHLFGDGFLASNGTTYLGYESYRGSPITMSMVGGTAFSLQGFDGAEGVDAVPQDRPAAEAIGVQGFRADGTTVTAELWLDGIHDGGARGTANDFQHFTLPATFSGLTSVRFYGIRADGRDGGIAMDNLVVDTGGVIPGCGTNSVGRTPLNDLGVNTYGGFAGGLYPNGANSRPAGHESAGLQIAGLIRPLDSLGQVDTANGHIGLVSIGMSNTNQEFEVFQFASNADATRNPRVTTVNGAQSGQTAFQWADPNSIAWTGLATAIANKGLSDSQIQVAWIKLTVNGQDVGGWQNYAPFPDTASLLQSKLKAVVRNLKVRFPNLKIAYLSSRIYGGHSTGYPEPVAYEEGFGVKWLIEEQINGDPELAFSGSGAVAPYLAWGPYLWADGLGSDGVVGGVPGRSDGLEYACQDFTDGEHPSTSGRQKVSDQLLTFFNTDTTAQVWYRDPNPPAGGTPYFADLDGIDDHLLVADADSLSFGNGTADTPLTFEMWFKPDTVTAKQNLLTRWAEGSNQEYKLYLGASTLRLDLRDSITSATVSVYAPVSQTALGGTWHHLAIAYDGRGGATAAAGVTFYLDGVAVPVTRVNNASYVAMSNRTLPLQIGRESPAFKQFNGSIDELRLWSVARTQNQIQTYMVAELSGTEAGLVAYWRFNEGSGTTVADDSPFNHVATMFSGPAWVSGGPMNPPAPDSTPPAISSIAVSNLSDTSVTIAFDTNEMTWGWVSYTQNAACPCTDVSDPNVGTHHALQLTGLNPNTSYVFEAKATDLAGNFQVGPTTSFRTLLPIDSTAPTVSITSPVPGSVADTVLVEATALDSVGVAGVQFKLDGVPLGPEDTTYPYAISWDTTTTRNGAHLVTAEARDAANNFGTTSVSVTVANAGNVTPVYLDLDGVDDHLLVADASSLSFGNGAADTPLTIEMWLKPDTVTAKQNLLTRWAEGSNQEYKLYLAASTLRLDLRDSITSATVSVYAPVSQAVLGGAWHHLAITYDGRGGTTAAAGVTFYLDGVIIPVIRLNTAAYVAMSNRALPLQIGRESPAFKQFNGSIDELRLWNVARSQTEIQSNMAAELAGTQTGLVAYWKFNEGTGATVADDSQTGNVASLYNNPTWLVGGPLP